MFYYYGGKTRIVNRYDAPHFPTIIEPFAGGAAYSMCHLGSAQKVILIEKDPRITELWERLLAMTPEQVMALPIPAVGDVTYDLLYMMAATSNAVSKCSYYTITDRMPVLIRRMLRRIARRLPEAKRKVEIIHGDYRDAPDTEATWFVDPPYQVTGVSAEGTSAPQGMGYASGCDAASLDYATLGEWCLSRRGQVIVCEQSGAAWLPFRPLHKTLNSVGRRLHEVVWTNPEYGQQLLFRDEAATRETRLNPAIPRP